MGQPESKKNRHSGLDPESRAKGFLSTSQRLAYGFWIPAFAGMAGIVLITVISVVNSRGHKPQTH
jgi:hypothetical protein